MDAPDPPGAASVRPRLVLTQAEALLVSALDEAGIGFVWSEGQHVLHANEPLLRMTGYALEELLAMPDPFLLLPEDQREALRAAMLERLAGRPAPSTVDTSIRRKDGSFLPARVTVRSVPRPDGVVDVIALVRERSSIPRPTEAKTLLAAIMATASWDHARLEAAGARFARDLGGDDILLNLLAFERLGLGSIVLERIHPPRYEFTGDGLAGQESAGDPPSCALATGFLVGLVERTTRRPALGAHVECRSRGDHACRFVVMLRPSRA